MSCLGTDCRDRCGDGRGMGEYAITSRCGGLPSSRAAANDLRRAHAGEGALGSSTANSDVCFDLQLTKDKGPGFAKRTVMYDMSYVVFGRRVQGGEAERPGRGVTGARKQGAKEKKKRKPKSKHEKVAPDIDTSRTRHPNRAMLRFFPCVTMDCGTAEGGQWRWTVEGLWRHRANIGGSRSVATPQRPSPRNHGTNARRQTGHREIYGDIP